MPDRDYYFDADKEDKRAKYTEYIERMFFLLGEHTGKKEYSSPELCKKAASAVVAFETLLASAHLTRTASRDPELTYNKMNIAQLSKITQPDLTWESYLATGGPPRGTPLHPPCDSRVCHVFLSVTIPDDLHPVIKRM